MRLELPRSARGGAQPRQQRQARDPQLPARGHRRPHGAGLRQDGGQADGDDLPRRGRPSARHHGDVQRLVRPRARHRHGRQYPRGEQARARRRMGALGGRHQRHRARLHQVGRSADLAAALRGIRGARLQGRDHAADGSGDARARRRAAGKPDPRRGDAAHPEARQGGAAAGRFRRARRARQDAGGGREPGHHRRPLCAHDGRHGSPR